MDNFVVNNNRLEASQDLSADTDYGETHVFLMQDWDGSNFQRKEWLATPLGAFLTQSDEPNTKLVSQDQWSVRLVALKDISKGDTITVDFTGWDFIEPEDVLS